MNIVGSEILERIQASETIKQHSYTFVVTPSPEFNVGAVPDELFSCTVLFCCTVVSKHANFEFVGERGESCFIISVYRLISRFLPDIVRQRCDSAGQDFCGVVWSLGLILQLIVNTFSADSSV